ncbi:MAG: hypothetical protein M1541_09400, partial [Acidobacteria bacterium]|nr:hypothetical protein [Acidobacteriota bacterium]
ILRRAMKIRWMIALPAALSAALLPSCPIEGRWWDADALRKALDLTGGADRSFRHAHGPDAKAPEFAYATALAGGVRHSVVVLAKTAVVTFEMGAGPADRPIVRVHNCGPALEQGPIESLDLAGARVADRVVIFHADARSATSAVSFDVAGPARLRFIIAGLAVGTWEIWHNGFLVEPGGAVARDSRVLYFEGAPGGYFLRRIG